MTKGQQRVIDWLVNKQARQAVAEQKGPGEPSLLIYHMWHVYPSNLIIIAVSRGVDGADYLPAIKSQDVTKRGWNSQPVATMECSMLLFWLSVFFFVRCTVNNYPLTDSSATHAFVCFIKPQEQPEAAQLEMNDDLMGYSFYYNTSLYILFGGLTRGRFKKKTQWFTSGQQRPTYPDHKSLIRLPKAGSYISHKVSGLHL